MPRSAAVREARSFHLGVAPSGPGTRTTKKKLHKKLSQGRFRKKKLHGKAAFHQSCMVETSRGRATFRSQRALPALCWCGHHRHSHTTFYNSSTLVSEHTLVAPYNSVRVYQHVPLRDRTPMAHTAYTCYLTEQARVPLTWAATGPQKRVTLHLEHVAKTGPQLIGRNPQIGR